VSRTERRFSLLLVLSLIGAGCADHEQPATGTATYDTKIRWTSYGIPHVTAKDWGSLGYGYAYATALDTVCVIARDLVMVNSERVRFFGPTSDNRASDLFHAAILTDERLATFDANQDERSESFTRGYVDGYNRYLEDHAGELPASCASAPWVRPIDATDLSRINVGVAVRYGLGRFQQAMANAAPPGQAVASVQQDFDLMSGIGSNAVAFGRATTESGRGMLFGNPHYPWRGSSRFHLIHTTIPGTVDVMGVSLYTTSRVAIGFNRDVAWSHTVSTAQRFTLYELELHPDDATRYRYGDDWRQMDAVPVTLGDETRNVYFTHYGPVLTTDALPWTNERAYSIRDAALENTLMAKTYDALNKAASIDEVEAAISLQGVAWTNTIAADRHGSAFYADISATPNIDETLIEACRISVGGLPPSVMVLDGSDPGCEWREDPRSPVPGALPAAEMPRLRRDDFVANSNDSYWLSNPHEPLEGYSPIIGPERTARSLRTRAGLTFIDELLANGGKVSADDVEAMFDSHRNFGAELLLDDLLRVCDNTNASVTSDGERVDVTPACTALAGWDRTQANGSRGAQVWTEFWRLANSIEGLYAVPFDAAEPVRTPRGLAIDDPDVSAALERALAQAQRTLEKAGIPLDAPWGKIQYAERNGERIPIPGGQGWAGMWSMIVANLKAQAGYTPIIHGNSFMQIISWDADGRLRPRGMLAYSQSQEPDSPHYADLTRLYSRGDWVEFPFTDAEIAADPNLRTVHLTE
jgi:acyl-homoserine-lactone acylase